MDAQTYEIQGPDGQTYEIQSDHQPTRQEVSAALTKVGARGPVKRGLFGLDVSNIPEPSRTKNPTSVTVGDLRADPSGSLQRMGTNLETDLQDPRLWAGIAASLIVPKMVDAVMPGNTPTSTPPQGGNYVQAVGKALMKKVGVDTDAIEKQTAINNLQATRMDLQAARSRTRQAKIRAELDAQQGPPRTQPTPAPVPRTAPVDEAGRTLGGYAGPERRVTSAGPPTGVLERRAANAQLAQTGGRKAAAVTSPAETASAPPSPAPPATAAPAPAAPPSSLSTQMVQAAQALKQAGLSEEEIAQSIRWMKQGIAPDQVVKRLVATRALLAGKPELTQLPNLQQALEEVRHR